MAGPTLSRFLGLFRLRDATNPTRLAAISSDGAVAVAEPRLTDNGYRQVTGLSTATALTVPADSVSAIVAVDGADVRWRMDGTNPTATVGNLMAVGDRLKFNEDELALVKFIEVDSGAILDIQYLKRPS